MNLFRTVGEQSPGSEGAEDTAGAGGAGGGAAAPGPEPTIGLLVKVFPKLSETFILEEILGLERRGVRLQLYALAEPTDALTHAQVRQVRAPLTRVPEAECSRDLLMRHLQLLAQHPLRWLATWGRALGSSVRGTFGGAPARGPGLREFMRAGWLAVQVQRDGLAHLHTHFISTPADIAELASRLSGLPFSISAHAKDIYLSAPASLRRKLLAARFTVTCTEFNRRTLAAIAPGAAVHRMYHGLDRSLFRPPAAPATATAPARAPASAPASPLLLSVGRLREKKGLDTLIDACALLHRRGRAFECEIVGYGPERAALQQRIETLGLAGRVRLVGALAREALIATYARTAVYVQPSRVAADGDRDGIPNVLLEAMAMGRPVVATRVSGIPELVVHGHNGLLVEPDAVPALAEAIERLLSERALALRLGERAVQSVAEQFDSERNLALLCALLGEGKARSPFGSPAPLAPPVQAASPAAAVPTAALVPLAPAPSGRIAYVMNGFPRLSETFIAHEIHQLERLGLPLHLYSVKCEREPLVHPVVHAIDAPLVYLPQATSLSGTTLARWLAAHLGVFWRAHWRVARRRPLAWLTTAGTALALAWQHRPRVRAARALAVPSLRKVFIKEFLQAGWIADAVRSEGDITHLHGHFCHGVATITWFASRLSGLPFSFTAHAKDIYQPELNPGRLLERKLGAARFVATCTCANAQVLRARHPRPEEVHTVYHGLDTDWFAPQPEPQPQPKAPPHPQPMILGVGRLVEKKGFEHLVRACALLAAMGLRFRCLIVGERGDAYERIAALIDELGLGDQVVLQSAVTQDALREIYRGARVFALPCQVGADGDRDGFPNVLAEAMAMGVPVVSTAISGIPEFIDDGVHGLLVPAGDAPALAGALGCLLTDDALHARLAGAARARICQRFDSRRTTVALRDLFLAQQQRVAVPRAGAPAAALCGMNTYGAQQGRGVPLAQVSRASPLAQVVQGAQVPQPSAESHPSQATQNAMASLT